jgi:hypothetical protein
MKKAEVHNICIEQEAEYHDFEEAYMKREQVKLREGEVEVGLGKFEVAGPKWAYWG